MFVCDADETLVRMHHWYKLLRKACIYFAFIVYSCDEYFCIVVPGMYAIVRYTCVSYVLYVVAGCDRSYVRNVARVVWCCLRVGHVGESARMASD